jgi:hypothetical protein
MLPWLSARPATQGEISECDAHAAISDGIITGTGIECSMNVRARITLVKNRALERPIIAQGGAVHFVGVGPSVEEATEDASRRAVDFAVARTSLSREEAYMLLSIIGELRIGTFSAPGHGNAANRPRGAVAGGWLERRAALGFRPLLFSYLHVAAPTAAGGSTRAGPRMPGPVGAFRPFA